MQSRRSKIELEKSVKAVEDGRAVFGDDHPNTLDLKRTLARNYQDSRQLLQARTIEEEIYSVQSRVLGERDYETLKTGYRLAKIMHDMGDTAAASVLQGKTLQILRDEFGDENDATEAAMLSMSLILESMKDTEGLLALYPTLTKVQAVLYGPNDPRTISTVAKSARALRRSGDKAAAKRIQRSMLRQATRSLAGRNKSSHD